MNLANKLTIVRIFLIPIFLIFIAVKGIPYGTILATFIFILAALTDKLDGYIARSRNQITKFGKLMDPLADKLLVTAAFISLMEYKVIPGWAAIVIIARELAVTGLRSIAAGEGTILAAGVWGKLKTVTQIVAIILCLLQVNVTQQKELTNFILHYPGLKEFLIVVSPIALWVAVIITIFSGFDYFIKNRHVIKTEK